MKLFKGLNRLVKLVLISNKISRLNSGVFSDLIAIKCLELHKNNIKILDSDVFNNCEKKGAEHPGKTAYKIILNQSIGIKNFYVSL